METLLESLRDELSEISANQVNDYTMRDVVDALNWIGHELKKFNDREEGK